MRDQALTIAGQCGRPLSRAVVMTERERKLPRASVYLGNSPASSRQGIGTLEGSGAKVR